ETLRNWSFRISQFAISAIDISQIVAEWVRAVADPEAMATFLCDRKAMPESTAQKLTPEILERSRRAWMDESVISPVNIHCEKKPDGQAGISNPIFGGLDTGRNCWFFARKLHAPDVKHVLH